MALTPELVVAFSNSMMWSKYQLKLLKGNSRIKIPFWELNESDLSGFEFMKCDFQAIIFKSVNLDNCTFRDCTFSNCSLENVSLVDAKLMECRMKSSDVENIVIRNTVISECQFESSTLTDIEIKDSNLNDTSISDSKINILRGTNISLSHVFIDKIQFTNITNICGIIQNLDISNCSFDKLSFIQTEFINCSFTDLSALTAKFATSNVHVCKITRPSIKKSSFSGCNFFSSQLIDVDLNELQINEIGFLGSSLIKCIWPKQKYSISFFGKYTPAPNLLCQPVEDVQGLTPSLRAEIRRSQIVDEKIKKNIHPVKKVGMWFWAVTSEYGRSISRLTSLCISVILALSILYWLLNIPYSFWQTPQLWISEWQFLVNNLFNSIKYISLNFIGIENLHGTINHQQEVISVITRFIGLIFFGLWIGVAANKFGSPS